MALNGDDPSHSLHGYRSATKERVTLIFADSKEVFDEELELVWGESQ